MKNTYLNKITHKPILWIFSWVLFLLVAVILSIIVIPSIFVNGVMPMYANNATKAEMHVSIANNFLIFFATVAYVIITLFLVIQSQEAIEQSKTEQRIRDIENRLEKFYIPLKDGLDALTPVDKWTKKFKDKNLSHMYLDKISKYSYLADEETYKLYEEYIISRCSKLKTITCKEKYKEPDFTAYWECEHFEKNYQNTNFDCSMYSEYCEHNHDILCEKFNICKKEEHTICTYNTDLKKQVIADIESYKNKMRELKNTSKVLK